VDWGIGKEFIGKTRSRKIGNGKREMRKWVETGNGAHRNGNTIFLIKGGEVTEPA